HHWICRADRSPHDSLALGKRSQISFALRGPRRGGITLRDGHVRAVDRWGNRAAHRNRDGAHRRALFRVVAAAAGGIAMTSSVARWSVRDVSYSPPGGVRTIVSNVSLEIAEAQF